MLLSTHSHRPDTTALHERAVHNVIAAMHEHLEDAFSLEAMAEVAVMSPFHFNRTFRELTGTPPCQFLSAVRLGHAKRLLLSTDLNVTDVCFEVGYNSLGTFIRRFTELVGLSPRRFRVLGRACGDMVPRREHRAGHAAPGCLAQVRGRVSALGGYDGPVFVALFADCIPQGRPRACRYLERPGEYSLHVPHGGRFQLFALGLPAAAQLRDYLLYPSALRGGGQALWVDEQGQVHGETDLTLHPPMALDPPILMTLPSLLTTRPA